jgi:3-oxoacyl-[acyl-carrier-protein] synthase III
MRIAAASHRVPETRYSNQDVIDIIVERSRHDCTDDELKAIQRWIGKSFQWTGSQHRHLAMNGEGMLDITKLAVSEALDKAELKPEEIDLVIYTGVARGWLEPATAAFIQNQAGAHNATCFDVLDACAGWLRGLQIADSLIATGACRNALIVAAEGGMLNFAELNLSSQERLRQHFATLTIGEAATATVIEAGTGPKPYFSFKSFAQDWDLAVLPLANHRDFAPGLFNGAKNAPKFFAESNRLIELAVDRIVDTYEGDRRLSDQGYDIIFSHAASMKANGLVADRLGLEIDKLVQTHALFGNTVSASVPLGISLAVDDGRLKRGDRALVVVGSAGITVGFARFVF